jgi:hypothetical protein
MIYELKFFDVFFRIKAISQEDSMSAKNTSRASELGSILMSGTTGFTTRKRTGVGMFVHFFMLACIIVLGASFLVYYGSMEGCLLVSAIGFSFAMVAHNLERLKKIKEALEFMNALFSSALGKGYQFCFIVKYTGELVFYNRPFQSVFTDYMNQESRTLDSLLTLYQVPQEHRNSITAIMTAKGDGDVNTTMQSKASNTAMPITLHIEKIERPTGFFIVRGK